MFQRQQRLSYRCASCARLYPIMLVAIALIIIALPSVASATTFSEVALTSRWGPHIYGQEHSPLAPVRVTVADSEGIQKGSAESSVSATGYYMFFEKNILGMDGSSIELRRGDRVTITIGTGNTAVAETIEAELSALFSSTQNKVFVEALPNQAIGVFKIVDASFEFLTQGTTNAEGNLVLNLTISPNELFYIWSADANSNFTSLEVWPAYGMVVLSDDSLWGSGYVSDATATVEVYNGDTKLAGTEVIALPDGSFLAHDFSPEIDIVSGNKIKIVSRYETTQFIANLEADIDYVDDTVLGKTTPYSFLIARVVPTADPSSSFDETATASSDGDFIINAGMESGDSIWLASIHPDGNITQMHREFGTSSSSHGNPVIYANKQNQNAGAGSIEELGPRSISSHAGANEITLDIQTAGVTFSSPPQATCDGVGLDGEVAALSSDRRTATWTVSECTIQTTGGSIMIDDISYDASMSTPEGDVLLAVGGNSGVTAEIVSNAVAINDLSVPTTSISVNPPAPNGKNDWYKETAPMITLYAEATATIHYQWDRETTQTVPSPTQFTAPEGEHMLIFYAVDATNNTETAQSRLFKVDTIAPTTPVLADVNTITASNITSVTVGGLAETDTVVHITASDGNNIIETTTTSGGTFGVSLDLSSLEETNAVVFTAQVEDQAGNKSAVSLPETALKDALPPITTITASIEPPNGKNGWYVTETTITLSVDEISTIFYRWDDGGDTTYTVPLVATEGETTLTAYAIDIEDDTGTAVSRLFKVDLTDPGQPALDPVATITASDVASVIVNGTTDTDTVVHIRATDGVNEVTETATVTGSGFIIAMDLISLADTDTITFTAYAEDEAGNESEVDSTTAFKDASPPEVEGTNPENGATGVDTDTAVISVTFSEFVETGTAFGGITLGYDSTTMSVSALIDSDTVNIPLDGPLAYETTFTVTLPAAAVKDGVGNEFETGHVFSFTTKKDIIPPVWSPTSTFTASEISQTRVKLSWAGASDNVAVTGYRIYSGIGTVHHATVGAGESTTITGLTPGTQYTFTIQARDAAGNWSGEPSCGPSVTVTTASSGGGGGGTSDPAPAAPKSLKVISTQNMVHLGWTANTESDLSGYNVYRKVKDASGSSTKLNPTRITGVEYQDATAQLGVVYVYYVTAVDNGNNESQKSNEVEAARIAVLAEDIFFDVRPGDWFASFVSRLASLNIIGGYPDKSFRPHQNLTRAEFAKMLCLAMGWELQEPATPSLNDVAKEHWSYRYVETAKARGALGGYPNGEFRPNNSITRAEIAAAIARALNLSDGSSDLTDIALHWAKDHIGACVKAGIISGYPGNVFRPNANATRAEASKMIAEVLDNK